MCTKTTWMIFKKFYGNELWQVSPFLSSNYESKKTENNGEVINKRKSKNLSVFMLIMNESLIQTLKLYVKRWEKIFLPFLE